MSIRQKIYSASVVVLALAAIICAEPTAADPWPGNKVLNGGKGYVTTPMGQVHYRDVGPRGDTSPILLLHQSPMSMVEFAEIQTIFTELGKRTIAVDTPGYGMSDTPPNLPSIPELADNLVPVLDQLKLRKVVVAGHHTGAAIAVAFAARHPDRTSALVIQGVPLLTAEEDAKYLARPAPFKTEPKQDGTPIGRGFPPPDDTHPVLSAREMANETWMTLTSYQVGQDIFPSVFRYDMWPDVKKITAPGLILSDKQDIVFQGSTRFAELRPDFTYEEFSQGGELGMMNNPERWSKTVADFVASHVR
jgi:pimeloyl-ACP methyl ester carboxylesterase